MIDHADIMDARGKEKGGHFHAVRFYDNDVSLCRIVAGFLREGLVVGQPALVIATQSHAQGIVAELRARELDVTTLILIQKNSSVRRAPPSIELAANAVTFRFARTARWWMFSGKRDATSPRFGSRCSGIVSRVPASSR